MLAQNKKAGSKNWLCKQKYPLPTHHHQDMQNYLHLPQKWLVQKMDVPKITYTSILCILDQLCLATSFPMNNLNRIGEIMEIDFQ